MRKGWWRLWFPHKSGWDSERKINKRGQRSPNKERGHKKERKGPNKMREKERRDNATMSFSTLVLQSSTMIFMIESLLCCHFHILVRIFFIIELGLYIPMMGFLKIALGLHEQASWMHTHLVSFLELSYIYISSASVAWQSLLTHIDIYWWASP